MSDGILSQDEIDALLGGDEPSDAYTNLDDVTPPGLDPAAVEELQSCLHQGLAAGVDVLSQRVQTTGDVQRRGIVHEQFGPLLRQTPGVVHLVEAEFTGALQGIVLFSLPQSTVLALDAVMVGEVSQDPGATTHLAGFAEAMQELSVHIASSLAPYTGVDVDLFVTRSADVEPTAADDSDLPIHHDDYVFQVTFDLSLGDLHSPIHIILPSEVAQDILAALTVVPPAPKHEVRTDYDASRRPSVGSAAPGETAMPPPVPGGTPIAAAGSSRPSTSVASAGTADHGIGRASVKQAQFEELGPKTIVSERSNLDFLLDVPLQVTVELGRTRMQIREVLELGKGSVIELAKLAGEPVDIFINGKLIAKGEVVTIDENFGVKIVDIVSKAERVNNLQ